VAALGLEKLVLETDMTIEFRCTNCDKLLRTPAGTEGKQAKCPDCGALMEIPAGTAFSPPPREPEFRSSVPESTPQPPDPRPRDAQFPPREPGFAPGPAAPRESGNPFQSPSLRSMEPEYGAAPRGFHPTRIEFGATVEYAWQVFKNNLGLLLGAGAITFGVSMGIGFVFLIFNVIVLGFGPGAEDQALKQAAVQFVENMISIVVQNFLYLGLARITLNLARRESASIGDLFSAGGYLLPVIAINIVLGICVFLGALLCIVPGVWIGLTFCLFWYMILDQNVGMIDSLKYSARATRGNKLVLLGLWLVSIGLTVLLGLPTCFIGLVFATPFFMMLFTVAYLGATGQLAPAMPTSTFTSAPAPAPAPGSAMTPPPTFE
jgi:hypothetical protein